MHLFKPISAALWLFLSVQATEAETGGFLCQTITLPGKGMKTRFADLNGQGRFDLLAVDSNGKQLLIYRQQAAGFTNAPDQIIGLPAHTGWIAPAHVETRTNFDLLISTAAGLNYYRQDNGRFDPKPRELLKASQVFTGDSSPALLPRFTNTAIPVISAAKAWIYQRNDQLEWTSGPPMLLKSAHGNWHNRWSGWTIGPEAARTLEVEQHYLAMPQTDASYTPENDGIAKLIATLKKAGQPNQPPRTTEVDHDGDGRKDLVVWQATWQTGRTDLYVFLRGTDGRLPERPVQILHCRGLPLPVNSTSAESPIADLNGDGRYELVLLEQDVIATSIGSLVDMALTRGVKVALTVRSFNHGVFARSGDTAVSFRIQLSLFGSWEWPMFICGDFNGDGRPDLVVKHSAAQWEIYYSTSDGHWFESQPAKTFEMPAQGYFEHRYLEVSDLNGDGQADIVSHDLDDPRIFILLTQPENPKGNP